MSKRKLTPRQHARELALQAIYQWQMSGNDVASIEQEFIEDNDVKSFDRAYFGNILHGVPRELTRIDEALQPHMTRSMDSVDPIERAIVRIATFELMECLDVPYRVVLNEAVERAKLFGATDGHKFVNGVMDKVAADLRSVEFKQHKTARP